MPIVGKEAIIRRTVGLCIDGLAINEGINCVVRFSQEGKLRKDIVDNDVIDYMLTNICGISVSNALQCILLLW